MAYTAQQIVRFVEENDVKFIRLAFCDLFGEQKNISIMPSELSRAFETGISFDASAVSGFLHVEESDLFLHPDPATLAVLPWRPSHGRVVRLFCDIRYPDGRPFAGDGRALLRSAVQEAAAQGYTCTIGPECEFYLTELDDAGRTTWNPHDRAGYCDIAPLDKGENVRREICLSLEEMGIRPASSHHEKGPGQNEIVFRYDDALTSADNVISFRGAVRTIAARNGLHATFMPKPFADDSGNGMHINLSLRRDDRNVFDPVDDQLTPPAAAFVAGILHHIPAMTAFLNPQTNSYARFGCCEAPQYVTWSRRNRSQLIRIPAASGHRARMELRSPDPSCNPYFAFSLLLFAGLEGIKKQLPLMPPCDTQPQDTAALPSSLDAALDLAADSTFIRAHIPARALEVYLEAKRAECQAQHQAEDVLEWERCRYGG